MKQKYLYVCLLFLFVFIIFTGCDKSDTNNENDKEIDSNKYTITYIVEDTTYDTQQVEPNSVAIKPNEPIVNNYKFMGWYTDNQKWNFEEKISKDITLTAKFDYGYDFLGTTILRLNDYGKSLDTIYIATNITNIGSSAFYEMDNITAVHIPNSVSNIENSAFWGCSNLESIIIPSSVLDIGDYAFCYCSKLSDVIISEGVLKIGYQSFRACSIKDIIIPDSVIRIEGCAFIGCGIENITLPFTGETRESVGNDAQLGHIFNNTSSNPNALGVPSTLKHVTISNGATRIKAEAFEDCEDITDIVLPKSVEIIENGAFSNCRNLKNINLNDGIKEISSFAFSLCYELTDIVFSKYLIRIKSNAFYKCQGLKSITIQSNLQSVSSDAFSSCSELKIVTFADGVTDICANFYGGCENFRKIVLPESIIKIDKTAFSYNIYNYANFYYKGNSNYWNSVVSSNDNSNLNSIEIYYYVANAPSIEGNFWHYLNGEITIWE